MSTNEEFDELARHKLQERRMEYSDADWQQARALLDARRRSKRWGWWAGGAGLLLLLAWMLLPGQGSDKAPSRAGVALPVEAPVRQVEHVAQQAVGSDDPRPGVQEESFAAAEVPEEDHVATTVLPKPTESGTATLPHRNGDHNVQALHALKAANAPAIPMASPEETQRATMKSMDSLVRHASLGTIGETAKQEEEATAASLPQAVAGTSSVDPAPVFQPELASVTESTTEVPSTAPDPGAMEQGLVVAQDPAGGPSTTGSPAAAAWKDTVAAAPTASVLPSAPADSALATSPAPTAPPIVPERAPWEITALGGVFTSTTRYSGRNSDEWSAALGKASSAGFGAELMHAGRNVSLGFGLHYGTYAERLRLDALDATSTTHQQYWYLAGIDTAVLVITDTLAGTPPTYTGQSMDTTIYVLAQGTDTVLHHQHIRDARDAVNRVSYVEVPLLADVHIVQGRWSIGLRGGPTIGLLSARRGAVPNSAGDGYTPFNDVAFREVVFGYTARAYVRYRFNAAWSVGLEPALRGQLFNSLDNGDLQRRSSAKGIQLSLTYRLR